MIASSIISPPRIEPPLNNILYASDPSLGIRRIEPAQMTELKPLPLLVCGGQNWLLAMIDVDARRLPNLEIL